MFVVFSGMAAVNAVVETLETGDHVVVSNQVKKTAILYEHENFFSQEKQAWG
jgi:cystathionine beta-lyase/cystathionine gamma-synthase